MPPVAVAEFQGVLGELANRAGVAISRLLPRLARMTLREQLVFITDAYPALLDPFLSASARMTTQWYAEQPTTGGRAATAAGPGARLTPAAFAPEPAQLPTPERLAVSGRWAMLQPQPLQAMRGSATRAIFDASRDTVLDNAEREGVRYARYASATACGFCRMLASRGGEYRSEAAALTVVARRRRGTRPLGERYHDNCKCLAVPVRDGVYEPPSYVEQWQNDYDRARLDGARTPNEIARAMDAMARQRRERLAETD